MRYLIMTLVLLWPSVATAEQHCGPQNYDSDEQPNFDCPGPGELELRVDLHPPASVPVHQGEEVVAQWDGALVHRDRLLEVGLSLKAVRRLRWLDRLRLTEEFEIRIHYEEQVAEARLRFAEEQRDVYRERATAAESRARSAEAWWRSPALWFAVGIIVAGALTAVTAYGLSAVGG